MEPSFQGWPFYQGDLLAFIDLKVACSHIHICAGLQHSCALSEACIINLRCSPLAWPPCLVCFSKVLGSSPGIAETAQGHCDRPSDSFLLRPESCAELMWCSPFALGRSMARSLTLKPPVYPIQRSGLSGAEAQLSAGQVVPPTGQTLETPDCGTVAAV